MGRNQTDILPAIQVNPGLTVLQAVAVDEDNRESGVVEAIYDVKEAEITADPAAQVVDPAAPAVNTAP